MSGPPVVGSVLTGLEVALLVWAATAPWRTLRPLVVGAARRAGRRWSRASRALSGQSADGPGAVVPGLRLGGARAGPGSGPTGPTGPTGLTGLAGPTGLTGRSRRSGEPSVDLTVVLDLVGAALGSGAGVPRALEAVGRAVGGGDGAGLARAATALLLGAGWSQAWEQTPGRLRPVADALRPAWVHGAPPGDALRVARDQLVHDRRARAKSAAARLGVRLVLPLGLCLLPAFVLLGLVPVMVALGSGLGAGFLGA